MVRQSNIATRGTLNIGQASPVNIESGSRIYYCLVQTCDQNHSNLYSVQFPLRLCDGTFWSKLYISVSSTLRDITIWIWSRADKLCPILECFKGNYQLLEDYSQIVTFVCIVCT